MNIITFEFFKRRKNLQLLKKRVPKKPSFQKLKQSLLESVESDCKNLNEAAVLFSGGVDSSLVALLVSKKVPRTILFAVGLENSADVASAKEAAALLNLPLLIKIVSREEIPPYLKKVKRLLKTNDLLQLQIALPEFIALETISHFGIKDIFSGQGADELFCGYAEFGRILKEKGYAAVENERWNKLEGMFPRNIKREQLLFRHSKLHAKMPYLEKNFMAQALAFPARQCISSPRDDLRKRVLRKLARQLRIPKKISEKRKKAIQYGSGLAGEIKHHQG